MSSNAFDLSCPHCGNTESIDVQARLWVRLTDEGSDADASHDGAHLWDDASPARCDECGHDAAVVHFKRGA